jgi:hypothetical protein
MDWFDDIQIQEVENFDFIEDDEIEKNDDKSFNDYLNSNYDY